MTTRARCVSLPGLATVVRLEWVSRPARARLGLSLAPPFKSPCTNPTANGRPGVMQVFVTVGETILAPAQNQPPALLAPTVARARTQQEMGLVERSKHPLSINPLSINPPLYLEPAGSLIWGMAPLGQVAGQGVGHFRNG